MPRLLAARAATLLAFAFTALTAFAAAAEPAGTLAGHVSNAATGDRLEGVRVTLPALGRATLTDQAGRYEFTGLPAGSLEVAATYTGLDAQRRTLTVPAGGRATLDFVLTSGVYRLEAFTVAGEREGGAAAITAQRNAANVKNVVAMDSYGNLPNMSASELAILLPGVTGAPQPRERHRRLHRARDGREPEQHHPRRRDALHPGRDGPPGPHQ